MYTKIHFAHEQNYMKSISYPDLKRHRSSMAEDAPATIEMLLGPFLMIKHKKFKPLHKPETSKEGFLIFY